MRIDLNPAAMPELGRSQGSTNATQGDDRMRQVAPNTDDVARLSTGSDAVQTLKMQLQGVPDVRQQRVDELRQAVSAGTYEISPQRIATAMLAQATGKLR